MSLPTHIYIKPGTKKWFTEQDDTEWDRECYVNAEKASMAYDIAYRKGVEFATKKATSITIAAVVGKVKLDSGEISKEEYADMILKRINP